MVGWQLGNDPVGRDRPRRFEGAKRLLKDIAEFWERNTFVQSFRHRVPTLLIVAEWDQDTPLFMAQECSVDSSTHHTSGKLCWLRVPCIVVEKNRMELSKKSSVSWMKSGSRRTTDEEGQVSTITQASLRVETNPLSDTGFNDRK